MQKKMYAISLVTEEKLDLLQCPPPQKELKRLLSHTGMFHLSIQKGPLKSWAEIFAVFVYRMFDLTYCDKVYNNNSHTHQRTR